MITLLGDDIKTHLIGRKGSRSFANCCSTTELFMRNHFTTLYNRSLCLGFDVAPVDLKIVPLRSQDTG